MSATGRASEGLDAAPDCAPDCAPGRGVVWRARWERWLALQHGRLAPWLPAALGLGILGYFLAPSEPSAAWGLAGLPPLGLGVWLSRRRPVLAWALAMLGLVVAGAGLAAWHAARMAPLLELPRTALEISGTVARVDTLPEGRRVTLATPRVAGGPPEERTLRIRLRADDPARPQVGDALGLRALVRAPGAPAYPGAWDFQRGAFFSGLGGSGFALGPASVTPGTAGPPPLAAARAGIESRVSAAIPGAAGSISVALLTGAQAGIPPAALAAMRDSGLAHLLSVSGLHIAIVMGVSFSVLRLAIALVPGLALRLPGKAIAAVGALGVGALYMLLCGNEVPMQRSLAMAALATLALLAGRRVLTLRAWALAATAVLLADPSSLLGPSFQMSFAAVLALIAGWDWLRPHLPAPEKTWRRRLVLGAVGLVATSVLAGAATTPFGLYHFGRFQLYGVAANAVAVPITSILVMPAGMAAVALMPLGLEGLALAPMRWGVEAVILVAETVAGWPGAALAAPPLPGWGLGLCALGMLWLALWRGWVRALGLPLLVLGMVSGMWARSPDLLVSEDARLVAVRVEGQVFVQRLAGASRMTQESWLRLWGAAAATHLPARGEALDGAISCDAAGCSLRPDYSATEVVLLRGAAPAEAACGRAALVISPEPVRGGCRAAVIDRFSVWRNGPHAVWLEANGRVRVLSDRRWRGDRPWVAPVPRPRNAAEPAAAIE